MDCPCVATHTPKPTELEPHAIREGEDEVVNLCPTTHKNVHKLMDAWKAYDGEPPWDVRRTYSVYTRELAERAYIDATIEYNDNVSYNDPVFYNS